MKSTSTVNQRSFGATLLGLYVTVSFVSAGLVFLVQPMATRLLLPKFGGSAAVWNTAMVVFQSLLLGGYLFAHAVVRFPARVRRALHLVLIALPLATLPFAIPEGLADGSPTLSVILTLTVMVGAPYFVLTTMSPTIQRWFGETNHPLAHNPYPLYAAGNVGSILGLLAYPFVLEPLFDLRQQAVAFAIGYAALAVLVGIIVGWFFANGAQTVGAEEATTRQDGGAAISTGRTIYLSFVPSFLLLGVTRHVSTDVAAFPLLWIVPLVIYLGSFVLAFRGPGRALPAATRALRLTLIPAVIIASGAASRVLVVAITIPLVVFALAAYVGHRRLYDGRPAVDQLTRFYLLLSVGGLLGGIGGALVAPVVFKSVLEYPIGLVLAATLLSQRAVSRPQMAKLIAVVLFGAALALGMVSGADVSRLLFFGAAGIVAFAGSWRAGVFTAAFAVLAVIVALPAAGSKILAAERTFYGTYQVRELSDVHVLLSGTTIHGAQVWSAEGPGQLAIGYYDPAGPAGHVLTGYADRTDVLDVGVIGLGAGALAAYLGPADSMTFYEIDQAVVEFAQDPALFAYLSDSQGRVDVVLGDGRLELARLDPDHDVLVVDAFSSDSIPIHLLTLEAVQLYLDSVKVDGIVMFHISNRHLVLSPVVGRIGLELGLHARVAAFQPGSEDTFASASIWVVMGKSAAAVDAATSHPMWTDIADDGPLWTDDYSNVVSVIRWK